MEHLELLINRALLLFFIAFFGCTPNESVLMIHEGSNDLDLFKINVTYRGKVYTGMVYKGPGVVKEIKKELISILKKENLKDISQAIGINAWPIN